MLTVGPTIALAKWPIRILIQISEGIEITGGDDAAAIAKVLVMERLVERSSENVPYTLTERGKVYLDALERTPLPVQQWVIPEVENE